MLFTSHDTSLLNVLHDDEVWLTDKEVNGTTDIVALADYRLDREQVSTNIEAAYLQGRFGAVPRVDDYDVQRALELLFPEA